MDLNVESHVSYLLVLARILPVSVFSPALGAHLIQGKTRMIIAIVLALAVMPEQASVQLSCLFSGIILQSVIGLMLAFLSAIPFYALQAAGEWIDINRGECISALFIPQMHSRGSSLSRLYLVTAVTLFFTGNGHLLMLADLNESFQVIPIDQAGLTDSMICGYLWHPDIFIKKTAELFFISVKFGLPVIFVLWITDVVLGALNRIAPALQVFFLGVPLKMWLGILIVSVLIRFYAFEMIEYLKEFCRFIT